MRTMKLTVVFNEQVRSAPENLFICVIITLSLKTSLPHFIIGRDLDKPHIASLNIFLLEPRANESVRSTCRVHARRESQSAPWPGILLFVCALPHWRQTPSGIH